MSLPSSLVINEPSFCASFITTTVCSVTFDISYDLIAKTVSLTTEN
jgi:hypothetical protein